MRPRTKKEDEIFKKITRFYDMADQNITIMAWREECNEAYGFYDGDRQWTDDEKKELQKRKQLPVVINKIAPPINNLSGTEIQTRFKTVYKARSNKEDEVRAARGLTAFAMQIQESEEVTYQQSLKFRDHLICGIGWSQYYKDGDRFVYEHVNPEEVLWDPSDTTPQLTNMNYVCRYKWMGIEDAVARFPKWADELRKFVALTNQNGAFENNAVSQSRTDITASRYLDAASDRLKIIEVQYKKEATLYKGYGFNGDPFETFDLETAEELADDKSQIEKTTGMKIMYGMFTFDLLLEYGPLPIQPVGNKDFSYIPLVYQRRFYDGVPQGIVRQAIDAQRELNKRRSKALHYLMSNTIEADADAFEGMNLDMIREEAARPDGVFLLKPSARFVRNTNLDMARGQIDMLRQSDMEIQQAMGIYSEALGAQTNASSGIAIERRQVNSVRNQIFAFDNLRMMKKREAKMLLNLIQHSGNRNLIAQVVDDQGLVDEIILNETYNDKGEKIVYNDIRTLVLDIHVEEVRDYSSPVELEAATLRELLSSPAAQILLRSEKLMARLGIAEAKDIAAEANELFGAVQQGAGPQGPNMGGAAPSAPSKPSLLDPTGGSSS